MKKKEKKSKLLYHKIYFTVSSFLSFNVISYSFTFIIYVSVLFETKIKKEFAFVGCSTSGLIVTYIIHIFVLFVNVDIFLSMSVIHQFPFFYSNAIIYHYLSMYNRSRRVFVKKECY